jgi:hypothetical protein
MIRCILALLALVLIAFPAHAQMGIGAPTATCPMGYNNGDGCPQAMQAQLQYPNLLTTAAQSGEVFTTNAFAGAISGGVLTVSGVPANTAATASWAVNAASIQIPSGLTIPAGLMVYDTSITGGQVLGAVKSYSGTTLTFAVPLNYASHGTTDTLVFEEILGAEVLSGSCLNAPNIHVSSNGTGTGGNGTYNLANAGSLSTSCSMTAMRRPWFNVAGVDYPIGNLTPVSQMHDPANCASVPSCSSWCTYAAVGGFGAPVLTCHPSSVANFVMTGFNFGPTGGHGCTALYNNGTNPVGSSILVTDNNFDNDTSCGWAGHFLVDIAGINTTVIYNHINGESGTIRWNVGTNAAVTAVNLGGDCGLIAYNVIENFQGRMISWNANHPRPNCQILIRNNILNGWASYSGGVHQEMLINQIAAGCPDPNNGEAAFLLDDNLIIYPPWNIASTSTLDIGSGAAGSTGPGLVCGDFELARNTTIANTAGGTSTRTGGGVSMTVGNSPGSPSNVATVTAVSAGTTLGYGEPFGTFYTINASAGDGTETGVAGNILNIKGTCPAGQTVGIGQEVLNVGAQVYIAALGSGTGCAGTYTMSGSGLIAGFSLVGSVDNGSGGAGTILTISSATCPATIGANYGISATGLGAGVTIHNIITGTGCTGTYQLNGSAALVTPGTTITISSAPILLGNQIFLAQEISGGYGVGSTWHYDYNMLGSQAWDLQGVSMYATMVNNGAFGYSTQGGMMELVPSTIVGTLYARDNFTDMTGVENGWLHVLNCNGGPGTNVFSGNYDMSGIISTVNMNEWDAQC